MSPSATLKPNGQRKMECARHCLNSAQYLLNAVHKRLRIWLMLRSSPVPLRTTKKTNSKPRTSCLACALQNPRRIKRPPLLSQHLYSKKTPFVHEYMRVISLITQKAPNKSSMAFFRTAPGVTFDTRTLSGIKGYFALVEWSILCLFLYSLNQLLSISDRTLSCVPPRR